jgi:hypothetical protein
MANQIVSHSHGLEVLGDDLGAFRRNIFTTARTIVFSKILIFVSIIEGARQEGNQEMSFPAKAHKEAENERKDRRWRALLSHVSRKASEVGSAVMSLIGLH